MKRLTEETVFSGLVTAWFLAALPTTRSPSLRKPTTDGVVRSPSELTRISGSEPSITAIAEFVVPRSIPMILAMYASFLRTDRPCTWGTAFKREDLVRSIYRTMQIYNLSVVVSSFLAIRF